jgi:hypothetical protein
MGRAWYVVRVREKVGPDKWVKKSKFFNARGPADAASKYKGSGVVMHSKKVDRTKVLGVGGFFRLGDDLLRELKGGGGTVAQPVEELPKHKSKRRFRRLHEQREKEAPDGLE